MLNWMIAIAWAQLQRAGPAAKQAVEADRAVMLATQTKHAQEAADRNDTTTAVQVHQEAHA